MEIPSKIYYLASSGQVLLITSEKEDYKDTTKEEDFSIYSELQKYSSDDIQYIELEYGTFMSTMNNIKSYSINLETKTLDCAVYTQEELDAQVLVLVEEQTISDRINTISQYANLDETSISDLENYILLREQNKITGDV